MQNARTLPKSVSVLRSIRECLASKRLANLRPVYLKGLLAYLLKLANFAGDVNIEEITTQILEKFLSETSVNPGTRASNAGRLASLFSFAKRKGYIVKNPVDGLEKIRLESKMPVVFTAEQCARMLFWTQAHKSSLLPFLALALFCGIRPDEIARLTWDCIDLTAGTIRLDASQTKTRHRRIVHLPAVATAWLRCGGKLPLKRTGRCRWQHNVKKALGIAQWPQDGLRHTAASMMLARDKDASRVATELGNSPSVLARHYVDLVNPSDAEKFWNLFPKDHSQLELELKQKPKNTGEKP